MSQEGILSPRAESVPGDPATIQDFHHVFHFDDADHHETNSKSLREDTNRCSRAIW